MQQLRREGDQCRRRGPGIDGTVVNLTTGTLTVSGDAIDDTAVRSAIQKAGYQTT